MIWELGPDAAAASAASATVSATAATATAGRCGRQGGRSERLALFGRVAAARRLGDWGRRCRGMVMNYRTEEIGLTGPGENWPELCEKSGLCAGGCGG